MAKPAEGKFHFIAWTGSFLFHAALLALFAACVMLHLPQFTVKTGRVSTAIELTLITEPKSMATPPIIAPFPPIPSPRDVPIPRAIPEPKPIAAAPPAARRTAPKATSHPAQGATQAQPDDLHNDAPIYPEESQTAGEEGTVILRVEVTADGLPASVTIAKSSGYFRLDQAARRAVLHWKFHPALAAGTPIRSEVETPVHFTLQ
jgi:protein TonB